MSDAAKPRLIEVLMPLEQASILSPREKNVRSGGRIRLKGKTPANLAAANEVLKKINPDWKFGG